MAARPLVEGDAVHLLLAHAEIEQRLFGDVERRLALGAHFAREALRQDEVHRGRHQEWLDAHVEEAVDRGRRVIGVERGEHEVARQCGLHRDLRGLEVADLADHDDVRILAQERAQRRGEVEADVLVHLHLVDPHQVVLDGVLRRADVLGDLVQLGERRVKRGGFARARRPRHQHHAVRHVDGLLEVVELLLLEAQLRHVELQVPLVEETHDDLLAEERGQGRDAEVHLLTLADLQLDAAVLGEAALGDIQLGHDLEARGDGVFEFQRRLHHLVEQAVDAVAHTHRLLVRLDVDVRRAALHGVHEDEVHQLDDGRLFRRALQIVGVQFFFGAPELNVDVVKAVDDVLVRQRRVVRLLDGLLDRRLARDDDFDVVAGDELEIVDGVDVRRVAHGDDE